MERLSSGAGDLPQQQVARRLIGSVSPQAPFGHVGADPQKGFRHDLRVHIAMRENGLGMDAGAVLPLFDVHRGGGK